VATPNIARLAYDAGFRGQDLLTAVAVAYAESGGDPKNYNPETAAGTPPGMGSYGLWQIYRKAHPEFADWDLNDPATNARAAFRVWKSAGGSFRPWSTFQHGSQLKFMPRAIAEVATMGVQEVSAGTMAFFAAMGLFVGAWFFTRRHPRTGR
jgi:hypothetical protein